MCKITTTTTEKLEEHDELESKVLITSSPATIRKLDEEHDDRIQRMMELSEAAGFAPGDLVFPA